MLVTVGINILKSDHPPSHKHSGSEDASRKQGGQGDCDGGTDTDHFHSGYGTFYIGGNQSAYVSH